jgi:asparagine synthase (glutamine-hydrolysing)
MPSWEPRPVVAAHWLLSHSRPRGRAGTLVSAADWAAPRVMRRKESDICGIAGFFAPDQSVEPWFASAVEQARHRGPDGDGAWAAGWTTATRLASIADGSVGGRSSAALGFVRLSILDLAPTGDQPMVVPGRAALAFNGEIYNYVELREELRTRGWAFTSSGDSEVLLKGWLEWQEGIFERLNGMWAMAIHDTDRDAMVLSRDRFGEKPLFWTPWRRGVAFASEVKQLRRFPDISIGLNGHRAAAYVQSGRPYLGPSSWFEGIHQLDPGTTLVVDRSGTRTRRYYDLGAATAAIEPSHEARDWQRRFADAFGSAVRIRLRSDVPVGTSLSAGVDSSAVMAEATALGHIGYHSFTVTSDERGLDEGPEAAAFAREMESVWHPVHVSSADFASTWDRLTRHQECPVPSTSMYGQWKVMEAARLAGVIVLLDGQGADEVLAGYHKFQAAILLARIRALDPGAVRAGWAFARHLGGPRVVLDAGSRYIGRLGRAPDLTPWLRVEPDTSTAAPRVVPDVRAMQVDDIERWSLPNLLAYVDRSAMAFGIETRLPYLDPQVVALSLAMPADVLTHRGWSKWPLRQTLADLGGTAPAWRRGKRWFGVPQRAWLRGPLTPFVDQWRRDPHPMWSDFIDVARMRQHGDAWTARRTSSAAQDGRVFQLVALDRFLRTWFDREAG